MLPISWSAWQVLYFAWSPSVGFLALNFVR